MDQIPWDIEAWFYEKCFLSGRMDESGQMAIQQQTVAQHAAPHDVRGEGAKAEAEASAMRSKVTMAGSGSGA